MLAALAEQRLAAVEHLSPALLQHQLPLAWRELVHQRWRSADPLLVLGQQQRGAAGRPNRCGSRPANHFGRLQHQPPPERSNCSKEEQCPCQITPLSSPGLTGRPSIPEAAMGYGGAAAYWIPRFRGE